MRKSIEDIAHIVREIPYKKVLPPELIEYHCYLLDAGHSILSILNCHLEEAKSSNDFDSYEIPIPVKYVLSKGYKIIDTENGIYILVDAPYEPDLGLVVDKKYFEY